MGHDIPMMQFEKILLDTKSTINEQLRNIDTNRNSVAILLEKFGSKDVMRELEKSQEKMLAKKKERFFEIAMTEGISHDAAKSIIQKHSEDVLRTFIEGSDVTQIVKLIQTSIASMLHDKCKADSNDSFFS